MVTTNAAIAGSSVECDPNILKQDLVTKPETLLLDYLAIDNIIERLSDEWDLVRRQEDIFREARISLSDTIALLKKLKDR